MNTVDNQEEDIILEDGSSESPDQTRPGDDQFTRNGMIMIRDDTTEHEEVKTRFLAGMKQYAKDTELVSVYKISGSSLTVKARYAAFRFYEEFVLKKKGHSKICYGWYGGSKEEITQIISHGFSRCNGQSHGVAVYLSPTNFLLDGLPSSSADENGIRHMLLCNVLLGKLEAIPAGSKQIYPSSEEFDSGVDNLEAPRRLIVWSAFMNSHIFPTHILSFKCPPSNGLLRNQMSELIKHGPYSVAALLLVLVKFLCPAKRVLIAKIFGEFRKRKITRIQLVQSVRRVVGDDQLLIRIIKSNRDRIAVRALRGTCGAQAAACTRGRMF